MLPKQRFTTKSHSYCNNTRTVASFLKHHSENSIISYRILTVLKWTSILSVCQPASLNNIQLHSYLLHFLTTKISPCLDNPIVLRKVITFLSLSFTFKMVRKSQKYVDRMLCSCADYVRSTNQPHIYMCYRGT